jgi:tryptophanyl-tRNA synthetase
MCAAHNCPAQFYLQKQLFEDPLMRILSGIKPSGSLHIGNYFAMIKPMVESQSEGSLLCFIANMHSQTTLFDAPRLKQLTTDALLDLLALGINPDTSVLWVQSDVPEVTELTWYLSQVTPVGLLQRCHAYKDALAKEIPANQGLFSYPVLMAADILLYQSDIVPVGRDQKQHVEVTRDIAVKFNQTYGETFTLPQPRINEAVAVVPGIDGQKMSKSYDNVLEIFGEGKPLKKKVMSIVTDSAPLEQPKEPQGNIIFELFKLVASRSDITAMAEKFRGGNYGYGHAKKELLTAYEEYFEPYRLKRKELENNLDYLQEIRRKGADKAREIAAPTMARVHEVTGIG